MEGTEGVGVVQVLPVGVLFELPGGDVCTLSPFKP